MERNSFLYRFRRKIQVLAHHCLPDEMMSKIYFYIVLHKRLNLDNPATFNEKIQWLKLNYYPYSDLVIDCTDKYLVRNYVSEKGFEDHLVPLIGVWEKAQEIEWNILPEKYVLKCNHGCAYNLIIEDNNHINKRRIIKQLNTWLREDFGAYNVEIHYSNIKKHLILCEEFIGRNLSDYKFFCFNGTPKYLYVSKDLINDRDAQIGFYYLDGTKMPLIRNDYKDLDNISFPGFYQEMLEAAKILSEDFPFVRVDFFVTDDFWYFAELTFTPGAGMMPFDPDSFDHVWGNELEI